MTRKYDQQNSVFGEWRPYAEAQPKVLLILALVNDYSYDVYMRVTMGNVREKREAGFSNSSSSQYGGHLGFGNCKKCVFWYREIDRDSICMNCVYFQRIP